MGVFMWQPNKREDLQHLRRLLEAGQIKPFIDRCYELDDVPDAFRYPERGHARGKIVITV
jgi:NADPH:quinone reductase-like Zn-dependent oxidoreductase